MKNSAGRRNPVARALALPVLKHRIVPARNKQEKRAKDKLRRSLREHANIADSIQPKHSGWRDDRLIEESKNGKIYPADREV